MAELPGDISGREHQDIGLDDDDSVGKQVKGNVGAKLSAQYLQHGTTLLTVKFAKVSASTNGNNTIVAAVASKKIRVINGLLMGAGTVNATFQSSAGGTAKTGAMPLIANVGFQIPFAPTGNFETASGELLNLSLDAAVLVAGWIAYVEI